MSAIAVLNWGGERHRRQYGLLVVSNMLTALASGMQQLLQGWLAVAWGHSLLFLAVFAVARVLPKIALTIPAGIICDRVPRLGVLVTCRITNVFASLLPLLGFVLPIPLAWLMAGIALGGALHAFDMPAGRAVLGDVTESSDLPSVVSLNHGGSHLAALIGPPFAFFLGVPGLVVAALLFLTAAVLTTGLRGSTPDAAAMTAVPSAVSSNIGEFAAFMQNTPTVTALVVLGAMPGLLDKGIALALPSLSQGNVTGVALMAPEIGAIIAALALSALSVRLSLSAIFLAILLYGLLVGLALGFSYEPQVLLLGLFSAGVAKLAFNTGSQTRLQETVPIELRGRVFSF